MLECIPTPRRRRMQRVDKAERKTKACVRTCLADGSNAVTVLTYIYDSVPPCRQSRNAHAIKNRDKRPISTLENRPVRSDGGKCDKFNSAVVFRPVVRRLRAVSYTSVRSVMSNRSARSIG